MDWYKALEWNSESQANAKKLVNKLWSASYKHSPKNLPTTSSTSSLEVPSTSHSKSQVDRTEDLFKNLFTDKMKKFQTTDDELKRYLGEPVEEANDGALQWWNVIFITKQLYLTRMEFGIHVCFATVFTMSRIILKGFRKFQKWRRMLCQRMELVFQWRDFFLVDRTC